MRISKAVGLVLNKFRRDHGFTLDDIATASRRYGSGWIAANVRNIENGGGKADSLPVLILLVQTMNDLTNGDMTLAEFFHLIQVSAGVDAIRITDSVAVRTVDVCAMLSNAYFVLVPDVTSGDPGRRGEIDEDARILDWYIGTQGGKVQKRATDHVPTAAERRAAKKIGITAHMFSAWCLILYGRFLDEIVLEKAGAGSSPQKRGRVTRLVVKEVKVFIDDVVLRYRENVVRVNSGVDSAPQQLVGA